MFRFSGPVCLFQTVRPFTRIPPPFPETVMSIESLLEKVVRAMTYRIAKTIRKHNTNIGEEESELFAKLLLYFCNVSAISFALLSWVILLVFSLAFLIGFGGSEIAMQYDDSTCPEPAPVEVVAEEIPSDHPGTTHTLREGESLEDLADKYYGMPGLWWHIRDANRDVYEGGIYAEPGTKLRIPPVGDEEERPFPADADGDGVPNDTDRCPASGADDTEMLKTGCSLKQIITSQGSGCTEIGWNDYDAGSTNTAYYRDCPNLPSRLTILVDHPWVDGQPGSEATNIRLAP